jgi:hypothetical protein
MRFIASLLSLYLTVTAEAFAPSSKSKSFTPTSSSLLSTAAETDDILKPKYEIESIPLRIGHGFDIHRMAPLQDAGQPVIIGGVEITHKDQKVKPILCQ